MNETTPVINLPPGEPVEMVALAVKKTAIRCRILSTGQPVTLLLPCREPMMVTPESEINPVLPDANI